MKKIIDGKKYDTEKAEEITTAYSDNQTDFSHWKETLFKTKKGAYFIYGRGGPLSRYSQPAWGGGTSGGADIIALTEKEAYQWCVKNDLVDTIEQYFSQYVEDA